MMDPCYRSNGRYRLSIHWHSVVTHAWIQDKTIDFVVEFTGGRVVDGYVAVGISTTNTLGYLFGEVSDFWLIHPVCIVNALLISTKLMHYPTQTDQTIVDYNFYPMALKRDGVLDLLDTSVDVTNQGFSPLPHYIEEIPKFYNTIQTERP
jgi:hypothetical protein